MIIINVAFLVMLVTMLTVTIERENNVLVSVKYPTIEPSQIYFILLLLFNLLLQLDCGGRGHFGLSKGISLERCFVYTSPQC